MENNHSDVSDVARYIIEKTGPIPEHKLHALCYYVQSWSLAVDGKPMFDSDFIANESGPFCPDLSTDILEPQES